MVKVTMTIEVTGDVYPATQMIGAVDELLEGFGKVVARSSGFARYRLQGEVEGQPLAILVDTKEEPA